MARLPAPVGAEALSWIRLTMSRMAGALTGDIRGHLVAPRVIRDRHGLQPAGPGNVIRDLLGLGGGAEAAPGRIDRRRGRPLGDVAAVQVDAGLNDPESDEHQQ